MSALVGLKERGEPLSFKPIAFANSPLDRQTICRIFAQILWPETDGDSVVEVLIDDDAAAFHRASPTLFVDLQNHIVEFDRVISVNRPLGLDREDTVEVQTVTRDKSRLRGLGGLDRKLFIELAHVAPFQESVGLLRGLLSF